MEKHGVNQKASVLTKRILNHHHSIRMAALHNQRDIWDGPKMGILDGCLHRTSRRSQDTPCPPPLVPFIDWKIATRLKCWFLLYNPVQLSPLLSRHELGPHCVPHAVLDAVSSGFPVERTDTQAPTEWVYLTHLCIPQASSSAQHTVGAQ